MNYIVERKTLTVKKAAPLDWRGKLWRSIEPSLSGVLRGIAGRMIFGSVKSQVKRARPAQFRAQPFEA